jgi:hypothetical protein
MPETTDLSAPLRRITPARGHFFFGYYEVPAADAQGRHLCHEVAFRDRFPTPADVAVLGTMPLPAPDTPVDAEQPFTPFAETRAWNFRQGSMLQWLGGQADTCLYNVFEGGQFGACVHNLATGARRILPLPVANVSRDGSKALCINMSRLYDYRPGYGYEELPDPFADVLAPEQDGVTVMDLATGAYRQVLSYAQLADFLARERVLCEPRKLVVNHITSNPAGSRFMFLLRAFVTEPGQHWFTLLLTAAPDGSDLRLLPTWGMASHYHWRNEDELLIWTFTGPEKKGALVVINDRTGERAVVDAGFFPNDGHCSYSPDGRWILYDKLHGCEHAGLPALGRRLLAGRRHGLYLGPVPLRASLPTNAGGARQEQRRPALRPAPALDARRPVHHLRLDPRGLPRHLLDGLAWARRLSGGGWPAPRHSA